MPQNNTKEIEAFEKTNTQKYGPKTCGRIHTILTWESKRKRQSTWKYVLHIKEMNFLLNFIIFALTISLLPLTSSNSSSQIGKTIPRKP